ncbi:hypothetical protein [Sphingomonas sp. 3-13AW]|uniref:hypothetical protein n=1 Tax=Sphingomonas sp. 3-13AW TaxID=3050450 RepID=UPI003BB51510
MSAADGVPDAPAHAPAAQARFRHDGWTPERQRRFLESIADGLTVEDGCAVVGLSVASAYALRRRAAGAGFALGWHAANLLARERIADTLLARALHGQTETGTRPDGGTWTRHRYDNSLATRMLARLDAQADAPAAATAHHAARIVAQEFDGFLDLLSRDAGPARAALFLAARVTDAADVEPVVALARADRFLQAGAGLEEAIGTGEGDDGLDIGGVRHAGGEEQRGAGGAGVAGKQVEEAVELLRDDACGVVGGGGGGRIGLRIEPREHAGGEAVVVAVARPGAAVGAGAGFGLAVEGAGEQRVGDAFARQQIGGVPAKREAGAGGATAQGIGGGDGQADDGAAVLHRQAVSDGFEEAALAFGRPAVVTKACLCGGGVGGSVGDAIGRAHRAAPRRRKRAAVRSATSRAPGCGGTGAPMRPAAR